MLISYLWYEIGRQRSGESPNDLNLKELLGLEQDMESAAKVIRDRKVGSTHRNLRPFLLTSFGIIENVCL